MAEPEIDEVVLDGETWYVARGERHLPQGAPSSPAITNEAPAVETPAAKARPAGTRTKRKPWWKFW